MQTDFKTKNEYRVFAKELRANLDMVKISYTICENIKQQDFYNFSESILGFYPFNNEVDLRELYKNTAIKWYLPKVDYSTRSIIIHSYKYGDTLVKNKWGIYEPCCDNEETDLRKIDVAIIPALMVDKRGHRLGYGAGFYDRFLPGLRKDCLKIVAIPEEFFVGHLPADHWDIPVDKVITEKNLYSL